MAMRSYRDMNPETLTRCHAELAAKSGDAYDRLVNGRHGGLEAYEANLNAATAALLQKGLTGDLPDLDEGEEGEMPSPAPSPVSGLVNTPTPEPAGSGLACHAASSGEVRSALMRSSSLRWRTVMPATDFMLRTRVSPFTGVHAFQLRLGSLDAAIPMPRPAAPSAVPA